MSTTIAYERVPVTELRRGDVIVLGNSASADYPAVPCQVVGVSPCHGGVSVVTGGQDVDYLPFDRLVVRLFAVSCVDDTTDRDDVALFPDLDSAMAYAMKTTWQDFTNEQDARGYLNALTPDEFGALVPFDDDQRRQPASCQCNVEGLMS